MENKKILVTTTTFPTFFEGDSTPPFVYELSKRLAKREDFQLFVLTPFRKGSKFFEERDGLKICRFKYGFTSLCEGAILPNLEKNKFLFFQIPFLFFFAFINLAKIVKKEKIDIIHAHWIIPQAFLSVLYKKIFRKKDLKIICTVHGGDIFGLKSIFARWFLKFSLKNCDFCTVNSQATRKEVLKIFPIENIKIVPMGIDLQKFSSKEDSDEIKRRYNIQGSFLLFVGSLRKEKGIKYLIQAMVKVLKRFSNSKLLIIGNGQYREDLEVLTRQLNLEKNIIFAGNIVNSELPKFYSAADITILPSAKYEGFGLVLIEALGVGTPVIGTNIGGIPDIIKNEITGLLVKPKDYLSLSNTIIRLLDDKPLREEIARNGQEYVKERFSWEIITNKFSEIIKNCVSH